MQNTLLAVLVALLVGAGGGYYLGHGMAAGDCAGDKLAGTTQAVTATAAVVEAGRESVQQDQRATVETGRREAATRTRQMKEAQAYEKTITTTSPGPGCDRDAESFGLLIGAIDRANASTDPDPAGGLPDGVRADAETPEPGPRGSAALGVGSGASL